MRFLTATLLLLATSATAAPTNNKQFERLVEFLSQFVQAATTTPVLPASDLPAPTGVFKYIGIGVGTQNYTCTDTSAGTTAVPVAGGAKATLYDATQFFEHVKPSDSDLTMKGATCAADRLNNGNFNGQRIPVLGLHYFDIAHTPTFDLGSKGFLKAKKVANVPAPSDACTGRNGAKAVDWLSLVDDGTGRSSVVNAVYRVETTGGYQPPTCGGADVSSGYILVDYAAAYVFYG